MDVGGWLRSLGLGEYEERFRDNKIDVDVLADLTDGDLEKLGLPIGDRKRFLRAVASSGGTVFRLVGVRETGDSLALGGGRQNFFVTRSFSAALSSIASASNCGLLQSRDGSTALPPPAPPGAATPPFFRCPMQTERSAEPSVFRRDEGGP
ncbi:MAG TPA: SAM domain-containing protein [Roseiarcus sp.]|nr:SAM domain-containing protein [Roseiarcus sp.]